MSRMKKTSGRISATASLRWSTDHLLLLTLLRGRRITSRGASVMLIARLLMREEVAGGGYTG